MLPALGSGRLPLMPSRRPHATTSTSAATNSTLRLSLINMSCSGDGVSQLHSHRRKTELNRVIAPSRRPSRRPSPGQTRLESTETNPDRGGAMQRSLPELSQLFRRWSEGDVAAFADIVPLVYETLRGLAHNRRRGESSDASLNTTGLVHEAYLKLAALRQTGFRDQTHFLAMASRVMRRLLVDHARARKANKRGKDAVHLVLDDDLGITDDEATLVQDLNEALEQLEVADERASQVLEQHYFGGLTLEETAEALAISPATAKRDLRYAKAWLGAYLPGPRLPEAIP